MTPETAKICNTYRTSLRRGKKLTMEIRENWNQVHKIEGEISSLKWIINSTNKEDIESKIEMLEKKLEVLKEIEVDLEIERSIDSISSSKELIRCFFEVNNIRTLHEYFFKEFIAPTDIDVNNTQINNSNITSNSSEPLSKDPIKNSSIKQEIMGEVDETVDGDSL